MKSPLDAATLYAAERTLLAWIRTGLALMGFGFVVARFGVFMRELIAARGEPVPPSQGASLWAGTALLILGVVVNIAATIKHRRELQRLSEGLPLPASFFSLGTVVALILAAIGLLMAVYLVLGLGAFEG
ncbi:YidH family protein [Planctomicrobium sp. SH664]|uniref:YidH family protein n=1 Tax=Planctomicrobium sp. SH664 TaxID=3448125 RepID=UPI003F5B77B8